MLTFDQIATLVWVMFLLSWWSAALWVGKAGTKAPLERRLAYFAGFTVGFAALFGADHGYYGHSRLWPASPPINLLLLAAETAAFAFGWWARLHLGRLWSGMLTLREGHHIIDTGPYRLVRHPIYTAFIVAAWAYALIEATPTSLAGAVILTAVMTIKARDEEGFLRRELGAAGYDAYAARTPMLMPRPYR